MCLFKGAVWLRKVSFVSLRGRCDCLVAAFLDTLLPSFWPRGPRFSRLRRMAAGLRGGHGSQPTYLGTCNVRAGYFVDTFWGLISFDRCFS